MLARREGSASGAAYDVGCGAGFDSFALASRFDKVVGIDTSARWTRAARRIARGAGVSHVSFERRHAEAHDPGPAFDYVYCNIMSEQVASRRALVERLVGAAGPGGEIFYAQSCEGYPATELKGAVERRDGREARLRLRQTINGFAGRSEFRFYASGSARPLFEAAGAVVVAEETRGDNGLATVERLWLRRPQSAGVPRAAGDSDDDPDYLALPPEMKALRPVFAAAVAGDESPADELVRQASEVGGRLGPWLVLLAMAIETPGARPRDAGWVAARLADKAPPRLRPRDPDWDRLRELMNEFDRLTPRGG